MLPVWQHKQEFLDTLAKSQVLILVGETGSGKTTQIPQFVVNAGYTKVACTQPHQLVAMTAARRVAEQMNVYIGGEVGYRLQFRGCCQNNTKLMYWRDETLLRELMADPLLHSYAVVILDEVHERTMATDLLLWLLKELLKKRSGLKLVLMTAALEVAERLCLYLGKGVPLLKIYKTVHDVAFEVQHVAMSYIRNPITDYMNAAVWLAGHVHQHYHPRGDILLFLPEEDMIDEACCKVLERIQTLPGAGPAEVFPLHSSLPIELQVKLFEPSSESPPVRKIMVSADIAETSLAMNGIVYVIDSGLCQQKVSTLSTESLVVLPISKDRARQRACRAGDTQPGKYFRLYPESSDLPPLRQPEILRCSLANAVLVLKKLGVDDLDLVGADLLDAPAPESLVRAMVQLKGLEALDDGGNLTPLGKLMCEFPVDPQMSKMLVVSPQFQCSHEILSIAAMLSVPNCFKHAAPAEIKAKFGHEDGDHLTLLNVYDAFCQTEIRKQIEWCEANYIDGETMISAEGKRKGLVQIMKRCKLEICKSKESQGTVNIRKCILAGYFMQVAHLEQSGHYRLVNHEQDVSFHRSCSLKCKPEFVVYNEFSISNKHIRINTGIFAEWLLDVAPSYDPSKFPFSKQLVITDDDIKGATNNRDDECQY